jgi:hypothetical protein
LPISKIATSSIIACAAAYPMRVTLVPIVTLLKLVHSSNAYAPMLVMLPGIVTLVRLVQSSNA